MLRSVSLLYWVRFLLCVDLGGCRIILILIFSLEEHKSVFLRTFHTDIVYRLILETQAKFSVDWRTFRFYYPLVCAQFGFAYLYFRQYLCGFRGNVLHFYLTVDWRTFRVIKLYKVCADFPGLKKFCTRISVFQRTNRTVFRVYAHIWPLYMRAVYYSVDLRTIQPINQ